VNEMLRFDIRVLDRARISRDARFDGKFFIGVTSTRIYCRPICPVRSPKRTNIRYYPTAAAAAEAGLRPCLRCRPEAAPNTPAWSGTLAAVRRGLRLIEEGFLDHRSVEELAAMLGIGTRHLHRLFMQHVGACPIAVAQTRRLHFAKRLLDETSLPIAEIALAVGYGSVRRFNDAFRKTYKRPPRELRNGRAARLDSALGEVKLRLAYRPPCDWISLHSFFYARAIPGVELAENGIYVRTIATPHGWATIRVQPVAGDHALELLVNRASPADLLHLSTVARRVFDLAADPETVNAVLKCDPLLGPLIDRRPGLRIPGAWNPFECAVRAIVEQQLNVGVARTFLARLVQRTGTPIAPIHGLTHLFPEPKAVVAADLSGLGLSKRRIAVLKELSAAILDGRLDFSASITDIMRGLSDIPGIDQWSTEYVALHALGEPDAFPSADLVLGRTSSQCGTVISASALEQTAEAWRPWRGYAAVHLWGAASEIHMEQSLPK
jgi:AraC family transcriptional regulator, regulatory protein of adaptative response / DNA-3-methyladenine glycosylase II